MTTRSLEFLRARGIPYEYIDVEKDASASEWVKARNGGRERKPTIDVGGEVIAEPSTRQLDELLRRAAIT